MDLKNLISRTSDDEYSTPSLPKQKLERGSSQPRLSIHSLMNDEEENDTKNVISTNHPSSSQRKEKSIESLPKRDIQVDKDPRSSAIPKPMVSTSTSDSIPTLDQRVAPFLPSDENGIMKDSVKNSEEENLRSEPKLQVINTSESQSDQSNFTKSKSSISPLDNQSSVVKVSEKPPLPQTKSSEDDDVTLSNGNEDEKKKEKEKEKEKEKGKENKVVNNDHKTSNINNSKKNETPIKDNYPIIGKEDKIAIEQVVNSKEESEKKMHKQIQKLEDLKKKEEIENFVEGKPKRYKNKPTWAQDYIPTFSQNSNSQNEGYGFKSDSSSFNNISKLSIPSITCSIPRNDFNKLVTEWIWANIEGVKQDYLDVPNITDYIEIESKLGNIWDKVKDRRIQLPVNTECVVATEYVNQECFFKPGITLENYNDLKSFISKLITEAAEHSGNGKPESKFIIENSHVVDLIASDSRRMDKPISGRVSLDIKTKRKTNSISKQRISDLYLHFPNGLFDIRLSLSVELPQELNDAAFEVFKKRVTLEREKERISYIHHATFTRIDLTKVREKNNRVPKYELELEINTPALLKSMNNVMEDPLYYIDLVQAFLDNTRIITRHLSMQRQ